MLLLYLLFHALQRVLYNASAQNDLEEFYAMVDFTNPGVLGNGNAFRKRYQVRKSVVI